MSDGPVGVLCSEDFATQVQIWSGLLSLRHRLADQWPPVDEVLPNATRAEIAFYNYRREFVPLEAAVFGESLSDEMNSDDVEIQLDIFMGWGVPAGAYHSERDPEVPTFLGGRSIKKKRDIAARLRRSWSLKCSSKPLDRPNDLPDRPPMTR
jgi:hypothetical protein